MVVCRIIDGCARHVITRAALFCGWLCFLSVRSSSTNAWAKRWPVACGDCDVVARREACFSCAVASRDRPRVRTACACGPPTCVNRQSPLKRCMCARLYVVKIKFVNDKRCRKLCIRFQKNRAYSRLETVVMNKMRKI